MDLKELPDKAACQIKTLFLEIGLTVDEIAKEHQLDQDDVLTLLMGMIAGFLRQEGRL